MSKSQIKRLLLTATYEQLVEHFYYLEVRLQDAHEETGRFRAALEFYADKYSYLLEPDADVARRLIAEDCSLVPGYSSHCGGKKAREALSYTSPGIKDPQPDVSIPQRVQTAVTEADEKYGDMLNHLAEGEKK